MSKASKFNRADEIGAARHEAMEKSRVKHNADDTKSLEMLQRQLGFVTTGNDKPVPLGLRINPA